MFGGGKPELWSLQDLPRQPTIFDVGANVGDFTRLALEVADRPVIHAFEPNPECMPKLRCCKGVRINEVAVGAEDGEATLYWTEGPCELGSLTRRRLEDIGPGYEAGSHGASAQSVSVLALDSYWSGGTIDLLKVDVEGHETGVFEGAARLLRERKVGRILFEYAYDWQFEDGAHPSLAAVAVMLWPTHSIFVWEAWNTPDAHMVLMDDPVRLEAEKVFGMFTAEPLR